MMQLNQFPQAHKILIGAISVFTLLLVFLPSENATASRQDNGLVVGERYPLEIALDSLQQDQEAQIPSREPQDDLSWQTFTVSEGDSLSRLFSRAGISAQTLYRLTHSEAETDPLLKIVPGDEIMIGTDKQGEFAALKYDLNKVRTLNITCTEQGFHSQIDEKQVDLRLEYTHADITSNFYNAGNSAGLSAALIMNLADVFSWDVDFALDIRAGDSFSVLYEQKYIDGEFVGNGQIVAAQFVNQGEVYRAIRYKDGRYYSPDGKAMKKAFLRAPVNFKYISSNFNPRRLHPVTGQVRAHRCIDYAAKTGTPVMAAGSGKVIRSGYNKLNGNYVYINHNETYLTKYLHLHKRFVKNGDKVKQGQRIGSVGATGRVTGAHLHYEFIVNGVHRNPRTVKLPDAQPIDKQELNAFLALADERVALLEQNQRLLLAMQQQ